MRPDKARAVHPPAVLVPERHQSSATPDGDVTADRQQRTRLWPESQPLCSFSSVTPHLTPDRQQGRPPPGLARPTLPVARTSPPLCREARTGSLKRQSGFPPSTCERKGRGSGGRPAQKRRRGAKEGASGSPPPGPQGEGPDAALHCRPLFPHLILLTRPPPPPAVRPASSVPPPASALRRGRLCPFPYLIWRRRLLIRLGPVPVAGSVRLGLVQQRDVIGGGRLEAVPHLPPGEQGSLSASSSGTDASPRQRRLRALSLPVAARSPQPPRRGSSCQPRP